MDKPPDFLSGDLEPPSEGEVFRPADPSRRGEAIAWLCAVAVALLGGAVFWRTGRMPPLTVSLLALFVVAGALISFGNWMDRSTRIQIDGPRLSYTSPLRKVRLRLEEVSEVWAIPAGRGWRIVVRGPGMSFQYRTGSTISLGATREMPIGFPEGRRLAAAIRKGAGLGPPEAADRGWVSRKAA